MGATKISGPGTTPNTTVVDATIFPVGGSGKPTTTGSKLSAYVLASSIFTGTPTSGSPISESFSGRGYYAIGDSVTLGIPGASNASLYAFPPVLANLYGLTLTNSGVNGQTAQTVAASGLSVIPTYSAGTMKYISFEWGINDIGAGRTSVQFVADMTTIINNAISKGWPTASIIVLSIPGSWTSGNPTTIATFNSALSTLCSSLSVNYVDVTTPFSATVPGAAAYTFEGIHPNDQGAALMAYTIYGQVKPNYSTSGMSFAFNGPVGFNNIKYYGASFVSSPYLLGWDSSTGAIGIANSLKRGTRVDSLFIVNGNLKQLSVVDPTGVGVNDFVLNNDMKIWSTLNSSVNGYIQVFASGSGATNFVNSFGGFSWGITSTASPSIAMTLGNTGNLSFPLGTTVITGTVPASGGVGGSWQPTDGSGNNIMTMNYTAGHYKFLGWDGTGGKNTNQNYLDMSFVGGAVFTLPTTIVNQTLQTTSTATAAGTTTLTVTSNGIQTFTGSTTQTVTLPVVTTLRNGFMFKIVNLSSGVVTVQTSGSNSVKVMAANSTLDLWVKDTTAGTGTASWNWYYNSALNN